MRYSRPEYGSTALYRCRQVAQRGTIHFDVIGRYSDDHTIERIGLFGFIGDRTMTSDGAPIPSAELSIIIPTFNERGNILSLIEAVDAALPNIRWEIIFVDDNSPDGTASLLRDVAQDDRRVRCLHRYGRRGLSSACVEGIMSTASPFVAVMDADHQHDERILRRMYEIISTGDASIVVGSRYVEGGSVGTWDQRRAAMSEVATRITNWITGSSIRDPMSGFFMIRRDVFLQVLPQLSSIGFKILLDIMASSERPLKAIEVPYTFRLRQQGVSKLDSMVLWEYLLLILDKSIGRYIPVRFVSFALVGGTGVLIHLCVLAVLFKFFSVPFHCGTNGRNIHGNHHKFRSE